MHLIGARISWQTQATVFAQAVFHDAMIRLDVRPWRVPDRCQSCFFQDIIGSLAIMLYSGLRLAFGLSEVCAALAGFQLRSVNGWYSNTGPLLGAAGKDAPGCCWDTLSPL